MDLHECRVISDATSVQPLCRSRVDLNIIGLVAEEVEADVGMTHKCKGSIVVLSISKSVEPNEERKEMTSGFE